MEKTKIIYTPNGTDDQDAEEVLLSDSEKFQPLFQYMQNSINMIEDSMHRMYQKKAEREARFTDDIENGTPVKIERWERDVDGDWTSTTSV
mgnify:CR=1 FL=1